LVASMSRLQLVRETIRITLERIEQHESQGGVEDWDSLTERYYFNEVDWKHQSIEQLRVKDKQAGEDALRLIQWFQAQADTSLRECKEYKILERVFHEQYEMTDTGVQMRKKMEPGNVKNPHDPDAQWATKDPSKHTEWIGYKAQVSETVSENPEAKQKGEPTEQFITEVTTTESIASDLDGMNRNLEIQKQRGLQPPSELFVDTAYVTDDTLAEAEQECRELVGPARPYPEKEGVIGLEHFVIDVATRSALCPAGKKSKKCSLIHDSYNNQVTYRFEWTSHCDHCHLKKSCTTRKDGRRTVSVGTHYDLLQKRRSEMKTEDFKKRMQQRHGIEGTISELTRMGMRRTRYRGLAKTTLANYFIGAACNVKRLLRLLIWKMQNVNEVQYASR
jgi:hypothetical protein